MDDLTIAIAGPSPTMHRLEVARELAEAQTAIERARMAHEVTLRDRGAGDLVHGKRDWAGGQGPDGEGPQRLDELLRYVRSISRYERRALSRRKKAMRLLESS
jgi:hypothetical protein